METLPGLLINTPPADVAGLSFFAKARLASAAAWSPDPTNPPLFFRLPTEGTAEQPDILAKWAANAPLAFVDQYIGNLRQYRAIAMDVGDQDGLRVDAGKLHDVLDKYGIANSFEIFHGTHTGALAVRFQNYVMPFFSRNLRRRPTASDRFVPGAMAHARTATGKSGTSFPGSLAWCAGLFLMLRARVGGQELCAFCVTPECQDKLGRSKGEGTGLVLLVSEWRRVAVASEREEG